MLAMVVKAATVGLLVVLAGVVIWGVVELAQHLMKSESKDDTEEIDTTPSDNQGNPKEHLQVPHEHEWIDGVRQ